MATKTLAFLALCALFASHVVVAQRIGAQETTRAGAGLTDDQAYLRAGLSANASDTLRKGNLTEGRIGISGEATAGEPETGVSGSVTYNGESLFDQSLKVVTPDGAEVSRDGVTYLGTGLKFNDDGSVSVVANGELLFNIPGIVIPGKAPAPAPDAGLPSLYFPGINITDIAKTFTDVGAGAFAPAEVYAVDVQVGLTDLPGIIAALRSIQGGVKPAKEKPSKPDGGRKMI